MQPDEQEKPEEETVNIELPKVQGEPKEPTFFEPYRPPVPFPKRLRKEKEEAQQKKFLEQFKQLHINIPFIDALVQTPTYAKYFKDLLSNKAKLVEASTVMMNERCSAVLLNKWPSKEKDPGSFTIPCQFNDLFILIL